ncbi:glycosyltransferase family 2 protein [Kitasatospora misakiensis]|uniref:Glycosyltransferase family 2 protein n=1 Tax=Kitasatospora misakiensis TaxID=67330 RepID=A0ABW0WZV7_9ACTN
MDATDERTTHTGGRRGRGRHSRLLPEAPHERRLTRAQSRNASARRNYLACAETSGPLQDGEGVDTVRFRTVSSPGVKFVLTLLVALNAVAGLVFVGWLMLPSHIPGPGVGWSADWRVNVARVCFCAVVTVEVVRLVQNLAVWVFAFRAKDPIPVTAQPGLKIAVLTTIVPAKEPLDIVEQTLSAMLEIEYDGEVDVWILDEGDDDRVKAMAARLGVHHFSRKGRPEYNQAEGEFRAKTKSGNHNSWRAEHEHKYDVVAQMDPDHVPLACFLERTLGYFRDPDTAFVVAPQVYGNMYENWVAHGASVQQYLFSGLVERGGNGMDAPLLIGTNHLYRPAAWQQIGGYQDSIIEDHLTSMRVQATENPATGRRWKGVYTPDVLAVGEGPTSWTDYFNQQKRWAFGIWEILLKTRLRKGIQLRLRQRVLYGLVQFYYPSVAATTVLGSLATAVYLACGITSIQLDTVLWTSLWGASMGSWFLLWLWLRRFNLAAHERREIGMAGMGLALFAGPVYVAAAIAAILRRPLAYAVTAKGDLRSAERLSTFRLHLLWAAVAAGLLAASFTLHHGIWLLRFWAGVSMFTGIAPPVISFVSARRIARAERRAAAELPAQRHAEAEDAGEAYEAYEAEAYRTDEAYETDGTRPDGTAARGARKAPERELAELLEPAPAGGSRKGGR